MENQEKVWDAIANQWQNFRQRPFSDLAGILNSTSAKWKPGKIIDIGCGNCRNLLEFAKKGFDCYGVDFSSEMLKQAAIFAKKNNFKVKLNLSKAQKLPFKDNSFDYALSIAVLHHLNKNDQIMALQEIKRILKNNGKAIITVWNKWQWKFLFKKKELMIPWHIKEKVYWRYYYMLNYFEMKNMLKKTGFRIIYSNGIFGKNLAFVVEK